MSGYSEEGCPGGRGCCPAAPGIGSAPDPLGIGSGGAGWWGIHSKEEADLGLVLQDALLHHQEALDRGPCGQQPGDRPWGLHTWGWARLERAPLAEGTPGGGHPWWRAPLAATMLESGPTWRLAQLGEGTPGEPPLPVKLSGWMVPSLRWLFSGKWEQPGYPPPWWCREDGFASAGACAGPSTRAGRLATGCARLSLRFSRPGGPRAPSVKLAGSEA